MTFFNKICLFLIASCIASCSKPLANFVLEAKDFKAPTSIKFLNESQKAESFIWDFGDGTSSSEIAPNHRYVLSGNYQVSLKALKGKKENILIKEVFIEAPSDCLIEMQTSVGTMTIKLYDATPKHRDNFIKLVENDFYDGLLFHRVIDGFMLQAGDPTSKNPDKNARLGSGGPGYTIDAEFVDTLYHIKGALAAARTGGPSNPEKKSSGSQFYIVHGKKTPENQLSYLANQKGIKYEGEILNAYSNNGGTPFLDQEYTVFGQVISGVNVIDSIAKVETISGDRPKTDVKILSVKVIK